MDDAAKAQARDGEAQWLNSTQLQHGYGSKLNHPENAGFGSCFHLPGATHFGYIFLTHSHMLPMVER